MMRKGIAIRSILLLLVGITAVVLLIFLVYRYATGRTMGMEECRARVISICTTCSNSGWSSIVGVPQDVRDCGDTTKGGFAEFGGLKTAGVCSDAETACKNLGLG